MQCVILHKETGQLIGPFNSNEEAAAWAELKMPNATLDFEDVMTPDEMFPPPRTEADSYAPFKPSKALRADCPMATCMNFGGCCFPTNCKPEP